MNNGTIVGFIDQLPVVFLIDSGAMINTVTEQIWEKLSSSEARLLKKNSNAIDKLLHMLPTHLFKLSLFSKHGLLSTKQNPEPMLNFL